MRGNVSSLEETKPKRSSSLHTEILWVAQTTAFKRDHHHLVIDATDIYGSPSFQGFEKLFKLLGDTGRKFNSSRWFHRGLPQRAALGSEERGRTPTITTTATTTTKIITTTTMEAVADPATQWVFTTLDEHRAGGSRTFPEMTVRWVESQTAKWGQISCTQCRSPQLQITSTCL
jgi:hypothetical protein